MSPQQKAQIAAQLARVAAVNTELVNTPKEEQRRSHKQKAAPDTVTGTDRHKPGYMAEYMRRAK